MNKKIIVGFLLAVIVLGAFFRLITLDKDVTGEEEDFVKAALGVANTQHAIFYQAEQAPAALALWHPPMYLYLLSAILKVSTSEIAIRSLNAIFKCSQAE